MKWIGKKLPALAASNLGLGLFSFLLAVGLWLFVNAGQKATERTIETHLEFHKIPSGLMVVNPDLGPVEVRLAGPPALLSTVDASQLRVVLELDGARPGTSTFRLSPDFFNPPRGVRVARISPSLINIKLEAIAVRSLPVTVRFTDKVPFGYRVAHTEVHPETVRVQGPAPDVNRMASVETLPFELEGERGQVTRELRLSAGGKLLSFAPDRVAVSVALEEEWITREFSRVEVKAKNFVGLYRVSPGRVYLRLSGPKRILAGLQMGEQAVHLDVKGLGPGSHTLPLTLDLPREVKVIEQRPNRFKVIIKPKGA